MPAHVGAGVPANRNVHRGLSRSTYDSHRGEYYVDELLATQTSASNNDISGYTLCANEWDSFALPSTCDVAYGAKGSFAFRSAQSGTITFNNATFGDPAPGAPKKGYYRLSGGQRFYAHANHLFSIAALTNQSGGVVERYSYDAYGQRKIFAADGITPRTTSSYNQQIGFTGRYLDKETGLWYFRNRYYSGSLGRFVSRDPIGYADGLDLYAAYFVPRFVDPSGLHKCVVQLANGPAGGPAEDSMPFSYGVHGGTWAFGTAGDGTLSVTNTGFSGVASAVGRHIEWYWLVGGNYRAEAKANGTMSCEYLSGNKCKASANGGEHTKTDDYAVALVSVSASVDGDSATFTTTTFAAWTVEPTTEGKIGVERKDVASAEVTIKLPGTRKQIKTTRSVTYKCVCEKSNDGHKHP